MRYQDITYTMIKDFLSSSNYSRLIDAQINIKSFLKEENQKRHMLFVKCMKMKEQGKDISKETPIYLAIADELEAAASIKEKVDMEILRRQGLDDFGF